MRNANGHSCELPTVRRETKGHLKFQFKDLQSLWSFCMTHPLLRKAHGHLAKQFPRHSTPHGYQEEEETSASRPYQLWRASEGAIQTRPHLRRLDQTPPLLRIHLGPLRPRPFHLLRVGFLLALLSADTRHGDRQLLCPQSHQYTAFSQREPRPQALERHVGMHNLILRAQWILSILPALLRKPSSRGLWLLYRPLRAIQIVELGYFILSFTLTLRLCDSSLTLGIHLDCSRGTISSTWWLPGSFSTLEWRWISISPWLLRMPRVL